MYVDNKIIIIDQPTVIKRDQTGILPHRARDADPSRPHRLRILARTLRYVIQRCIGVWRAFGRSLWRGMVLDDETFKAQL